MSPLDSSTRARARDGARDSGPAPRSFGPASQAIAGLALGSVAIGLALLMAGGGLPGGDDAPGATPPSGDADARAIAQATRAAMGAATAATSASPGVPSTAHDTGAPPSAAALRVAVDRLARTPSGVVVAVLRVNGGPPARHAVGDALGPGVRLAAIDADGAWIERGGRREHLGLPAGAVALATSPRTEPPAPSVIAVSPDRAHPARSGIDRFIAAETDRAAGNAPQ